jgi:uncharacterized protein (DUF885 family)
MRQISRRYVLAGGAAAAALLGGCGAWHGTMRMVGLEHRPKSKTAAKADPGPQLRRELDGLATAMLKEQPELATSLAVTPAQAGGYYQNRLSDVSPAGMERQVTIMKSGMAELERIGRDSLSPADRVSYDVVHEAYSNAIAGARFGWGSFGFGAPTPYVSTQIDGAYTSVPSFLDAQHQIHAARDVDDYLARLDAFATVLDQESARIEADAGKGIVPPDFVIDGAIKQLRGLAAQSPSHSIVVQSLKRRIGDAQGLDDAHQKQALKDAAATAAEKVLPALKRQIESFTQIRKGATHDAGIWRLKDGDAFYAAALRANTTSTLSPDEIHKMGLDLVKELGSEMDAILQAQGLTKGTLAERIQHLFKDPKQLYPNTDKGREEILKDLNHQIEALQPYLKQNFGILAKAKLEVRRVPPFKEAGAPGGYYDNGALDGSRPGYYYINLRDTHEWPKFTLPTLTYHEGEPGHHWQGSIAQEQGDLPLIRRAILWFPGYGEGWALYSERLADEMGLYKDDPLGRLGYLKDAALRAGRLVVDTGMHTKRWTREQAIDFMIAANGDSKTAVTTEIERYCVWPGQACSYMIGREAIRTLREDSKTALGAKFDIKGFHDVVLRNGAMPLSVLDGVVKAWIAAQLPPPAPVKRKH